MIQLVLEIDATDDIVDSDKLEISLAGVAQQIERQHGRKYRGVAVEVLAKLAKARNCNVLITPDEHGLRISFQTLNPVPEYLKERAIAQLGA